MFKRKRKHEIAFSEDGVQVITHDEDLAVELVSAWIQVFSEAPKEKPKQKIGFSNDHVTEVEADTELDRRDQPLELDDDDVEEVDEGVYRQRRR